MVTKAHVESFQVWMIGTRSAMIALNKHKGLQQFLRYFVEEGELDASPIARVGSRTLLRSSCRSLAMTPRKLLASLVSPPLVTFGPKSPSG